MALTSTTIALAKAAGDKTVKLTSATGIANKMLILVEGEYMRVTDITNTPTIGVVPGYQGTTATQHEILAPAWFGLAGDFTNVPLGPSFNQLLKSAASPANQTGFAADTYLVGSAVPVPPAGFTNGMRYTCTFDMVKTAAGTATPIVVVRIGTLGTVSDAAILTFTFGAGTAAVDTGTVVVTAHFRIIGGSAVLAGTCEIRHALAATGLTATGASGQGQIAVVSSAFDATPSNTIIGVSFNGGASFAGTNTIVEAELKGF
jgi:hypothetical protein